MGRIYLFFSGHGTFEPTTGKAYLAPWDMNLDRLDARGIPIEELLRTLGALSADAAYVFMDACFSGEQLRTPNTGGPQRQDSSPVIVMAASGARQITGVSRSHAHGLFSQHLFAGLGGRADANSDTRITLDELTAYIRKNVIKDARLDNRDQVPSIRTNPPVDGHEHVMVQLR